MSNKINFFFHIHYNNYSFFLHNYVIVHNYIISHTTAARLDILDRSRYIECIIIFYNVVIQNQCCGSGFKLDQNSGSGSKFNVRRSTTMFIKHT